MRTFHDKLLVHCDQHLQMAEYELSKMIKQQIIHYMHLCSITSIANKYSQIAEHTSRDCRLMVFMPLAEAVTKEPVLLKQ